MEEEYIKEIEKLLKKCDLRKLKLIVGYVKGLLGIKQFIR